MGLLVINYSITYLLLTMEELFRRCSLFDAKMKLHGWKPWCPLMAYLYSSNIWWSQFTVENLGFVPQNKSISS